MSILELCVQFFIRGEYHPVKIWPCDLTSGVPTFTSNFEYKPLSKRDTHAAVQTNKTSPITPREQKEAFRLFDRMLDGLQILSNTSKHDQTATQGGL